jgi:hypothetical protein
MLIGYSQLPLPELTSVKRMRESAGRLPDGSGFFTATVKTPSKEGGPGSGPQGGRHPKTKSSSMSKIPDHNKVKAKVLLSHGFKRVKDGKFKDEDGNKVPVHRFQKGSDIVEMNASRSPYNKGVWDHIRGQRLIAQDSRADELHRYLNHRGI